MNKILNFHTLIWLCSVILSAACTKPIARSPSPVNNQAYTAAAETIAAKLTEITIPSGTQTLGVVPLLETLPSTSTPLPSKTQLPTDIPPTSTTTPTPSQTPIDPAASLGDPTWKDDFTNGAYWPLYNDSHLKMVIQDGKLNMIALIPNRKDPWDGWMVSQPLLTDFYLSVTASFGNCSGLDRYGLLARAASDAGHSYLFGISCDGKYSLRIWNGFKFIELIPWTPSEYIHQGFQQTNQLGFRAEETKISLFINGNLLTDLEDNTYSQGTFGLFIGAVETESFYVLFDEIAYWEIQ